jgi:hypothetical protein
MKKNLLIIATIILGIVAAFIIYTKVTNSKLLDSNAVINEVVTNIGKDQDNGAIQTISDVGQDQFSITDLSYSTNFLGFSVPSDVEKASNYVLLDSVSYVNSQITINLQQKQKCSSNRKLASQAGFYYYQDNVLILYNMVNSSAVEDAMDCVVRLEFSISNFVVDDSNNLSIRWQTEANTISSFPICFYKGKPYNNSDVFASGEKCITCTCLDGSVKCEENAKCLENLEEESEETATGSVYFDNPQYSRYEGEENENECNSDDNCFTGGCSQEICSAVNGVMSDCSAVSKIENISCKCIDTKCLWISN